MQIRLSIKPGNIMNHSSLKLLAVSAFALGLSACISFPSGPAGPQGATGETGDTGATGNTGNTGNTIVVVPPQ